jgi:hypothetical protein
MVEPCLQFPICLHDIVLSYIINYKETFIFLTPFGRRRRAQADGQTDV